MLRPNSANLSQGAPIHPPRPHRGPIPGGGYEKDIFVASSADGGETWSAPKRVLHTSGKSSGADIEILADRLLLAWGEVNNGDRRVFFAESADWGESWGRIRRFKTGARAEPIWHEPALVAADGRAHLFYPVSLPGQLERLVYRHRPLD